ncbi:hypothetical protein CEXT_392321 [Caerostris extrusa]|uniref:Uncharacterized protein n=1 Tax=Caerostris extrusa TaxID=172846 RepID=A0AAV4Y3D6_CAEEX|nr:hypothetical protein CEXT_392321 [Caerostris extrusa]
MSPCGLHCAAGCYCQLRSFSGLPPMRVKRWLNKSKQLLSHTSSPRCMTESERACPKCPKRFFRSSRVTISDIA